MEISFELTEEDIVALHRIPANPVHGCPDGNRGSPKKRRVNWVWVGLTVGLTATFLIMDAVNGPRVGADVLLWKVALPLGLVGLAVAVAFAHRRRGTKTHTRHWLRQGQNARVLGPRRLALTPSAVTLTMPLEAGTSSWKLVKDIRVTSGHLFIQFVTDKAHVVPRRAFATEHAFEEFVTAAGHYWELAKADAEEASNPTEVSLLAADFDGSPAGTYSSHQVQEVAFQLSEEDVLAFLRFPKDELGPEAQVQRRVGWWDWVRLLGAAAVAVGVFVWLDGGDLKEALIYFGLASAFLLALGGWLWFQNRPSRRQVRRLLKQPMHDRLLEPQQLRFTPAEFTQVTSLATATRSWKLVDHITVKGDHAFIVLVDLLCYIIPRRAFPDDKAFTRFVETLESYWDMARRF